MDGDNYRTRPATGYARMRVAPPTVDTGAGFWNKPVPYQVEATEKGETADSGRMINAMETDNFAVMTMMAKVFVSQAVGFFLFSVAVFSMLAFLATSDPNHKVTCALSVVVNLVAAMHYYAIVKFRRLEAEGYWSTVAIEFAVDACRHSEWVVTLCFLVRKLYFLINHDPFDAGRDFFLSVDAAVGTAALMVLLGALSRLGTDEMWDWNGGAQLAACVISGVIPYVGSLACFALLLVDLANAAADMENAYVFRSFFFVWLGYPAVSLVSIVARNAAYRLEHAHRGAVNPMLSMFKDLGYGLLDCWSKGAFGLYTAHAVFGLSFFGAPAAGPYAWPAPSPPPAS